MNIFSKSFCLLILVCLPTIIIAGEKNPIEQVSKERIVHFPKNRSLGQLKIKDAVIKRKIRSFHYWISEGYTRWELLGEATGDVVIPKGKLLALDVSQSGWRDLSALLKLQPDDLYMLSIPGPYPSGPMPGDSIMSHIAYLTGLKELKLGKTRITVRGWKLIRSLTSLELLSVGRGITDAGLAEIAHLSSLKALYLRDHNLSNTGLAHLAQITSLEELELSGGRINDAALSHLTKLPSLEYLLLTGENFTDNGMVHLKNVPSLRTLHFGHMTQLTDKALVHLCQIPNLERLNLHWNENITDSGVAHLAKLSSLKMLDVGHARVTNEGSGYLSGIRSLEYLDINARRLNDTGLQHLSELNNLKYLKVSRPHYGNPNMDKDYYTDKSVMSLSKLNQLEELTVGSVGLTDKSMPYIAKLKNLRSLNLFGCSITNRGLAELRTLKSLKKLSVSYGDVTVSGLTQLSALPNLTNLKVGSFRRDISVLDLDGFAKLENLSLGFNRRSGDSFIDADLISLGKLKSIKWLQINPHNFTDAGLIYISGLTKLERLGIGGSKFTDNGLKHLAGLTKLNHLTINDGYITDEGLYQLENLKALRYLNITSRKRISAAARHRLRQKLPNLSNLRVQLKGNSPARVRKR
jgi:Leucine-rich repeat (LRR) protein